MQRLRQRSIKLLGISGEPGFAHGRQAIKSNYSGCSCKRHVQTVSLGASVTPGTGVKPPDRLQGMAHTSGMVLRRRQCVTALSAAVCGKVSHLRRTAELRRVGPLLCVTVEWGLSVSAETSGSRADSLARGSPGLQGPDVNTMVRFLVSPRSYCRREVGSNIQLGRACGKDALRCNRKEVFMCTSEPASRASGRLVGLKVNSSEQCLK